MRHSGAFLQLFDISTLWGFCLHWENHLLVKILSKVESSVQSQHVCFKNAYCLLGNSSALGQRQLTSLVVPRSEGPALGFMPRCCRVEMLGSFWTRCLCFLFVLGPTNYNPWLPVFIYLVSFKIHNYLPGVNIIIPIVQSRTWRLREFLKITGVEKGNVIKKCWPNSPLSFHLRPVWF